MEWNEIESKSDLEASSDETRQECVQVYMRVRVLFVVFVYNEKNKRKEY